MSPRNRHGLLLSCLLSTFALVTIGGTPGVAADERLPAQVGAEALHAEGITGRGVTIAVVDGDTALGPETLQAGDGHRRLLAVYDAVSASGHGEPPVPGQGREREGAVGRLAAMLSSRRDADGRYEGIAPNADVVLVKALGSDGTGRPADVIRAIEWVVANRDRYGIRVLDLPLAAAARPRFWEDPLNQAVIDAWRAGIVVVVPAGNGGPSPATIAAPGDVPHVITVGAATVGRGEALVPLYSATGPTLDGFIKPEIIAPAGADEAAPALGATATVRRPTAGTSVSSVIVSGVVALLLQASPWLTPDEVKHRLLASARPAVAPGGEGYSVLRAGAGQIDALAARGITWSDVAAWGITWSDAAAWGITWSDWTDNGLTWSD